VMLLGACTVRGAAPATSFATVPAGGYRVQAAATGDAVALARQVGSGLVIALGDASAWLDPDAATAQNLNFVRNVLLW